MLGDEGTIYGRSKMDLGADWPGGTILLSVPLTCGYSCCAVSLVFGAASILKVSDSIPGSGAPTFPQLRQFGRLIPHSLYLDGLGTGLPEGEIV
jgi:hypothetical protein